jgi:uncharacterized protein (UPF0332 family)
MTTAVIRDDSGEFEIRNALSRSYYALFHACHAWLAAKNVPLGKRKNRPDPFEQIRSKREKEYGDRIDELWKLRKQADYDEPEYFQDDLDRFRLSGREGQDRMTAEFDSYISEIED